MPDNNEKYDLYTERIKQTPAIKYRRFIRFGKMVLVTAVLAGVAGMCFGAAQRFMYKAGDNRDKTLREEVTFPQDEYPDVTGTDDNNTENQENGNTENVSEISTEGKEPGVQGNVPDGAYNQNGSSMYLMQYQEFKGILDEINRSVAQIKSTSYKGDDYLASIWQETSGNGLVIAQNGVEYLILTQYSLCSGADSITATFQQKYTVDARLVTGNSITDTAVIAVNIRDLPAAAVENMRISPVGNSYLVKQGQPVIALGCLYGISNSAECGMAVNTSEIIYDSDGRYGMIYTNIASSENNSGFLFNTAGEAIGIVTDNYKTNGNVAAYGISDLKKIIENMSNNKQTGYLGIIGYDISEEDAQKNGIPTGAYVTRTDEGSPAYYAGIQSGDIITRINDRNILNMYNVSMALSEYEPETKVVVTVYRKGREGYVPIEFTITLSVK